MGDKIKVGDKVRVLRGFEHVLFPDLALREGQTYVVTHVTDTGTGHGSSDYGINVDNGDGGHGSWDADRFELLTEVDKPTFQVGDAVEALAGNAYNWQIGARGIVTAVHDDDDDGMWPLEVRIGNGYSLRTGSSEVRLVTADEQFKPTQAISSDVQEAYNAIHLLFWGIGTDVATALHNNDLNAAQYGRNILGGLDTALKALEREYPTLDKEID